jgi:predicted nucleic acid-binding protein
VAYYLDTSAVVKLVVGEAESVALIAWADDHDGSLVSSDLCRTELLRTTRRVAPELMTQARAVLDSLTLLVLSTSTFERAATLDPVLLRSLDSLHLAAALELGDDLDGIVAYDGRLAEAAATLGISVLAPN